ncbi:MAG: type VI secretion system-associated FHA domain protein TagH [Burkholderiales bacterium]|nr:type VI secretion system-associated FHA domain protein TagH [Burkholderiales bacterium]
MTVLVHFSGPSFTKTVTLSQGGGALEAGRDPLAPVHLPDEERLLSRRHVSLEWADAGARLTVLSKINAVTTSRGDVSAGQSTLLAHGEKAQLGRYSLSIEVTAGAPAAPPPAPADPLGLFATSPTAPSASVFDNPFFQAPPAAAPARTPASVLDQLSGAPPVGASRSLSGPGGGQVNDILDVFGTGPQPARSSSIDDFLGKAPLAQGPLGAAQMLKPQVQQERRSLATDHVHDFNLPLTPVIAKAPPPPLARSDDPFAALDNWGSPAAPVAPPPFQPPPPRMEAPVPPVPVRPPIEVDVPLDALEEGTRPIMRRPGAKAPVAVVQPPAPVAKAPALPVAAPAPAKPTPSHEMPTLGRQEFDAIQALCKGLGIPPPSNLRPEDCEATGQAIRQLVACVVELLSVRAELKRELNSPDRTMLVARENNPLKSGLTIEELLNYLFFMPQGAAGYMSAQKAIQESTADLRAHEFASLVALRATVEGSIREFDPAALSKALKAKRKSILPKGMWDLYCKEYERKSEHMADWLEEIFNKHYLPAYTREGEKVRRRS